MKNILLHPTYFGPISQFVAMVHAEKVLFENEDNYQKQTYRNRMYIYGANGKLSLNIPIKHTGNRKQHQKYKEVKIENSFNWQKQHWKSLQTTYRTSPFFEFYEDDLAPLYHKNYIFLLDFNEACLALALNCLQLEIKTQKTTEYILEPHSATDGRFLVNAKSDEKHILEPYTQVFDSKFGYFSNLSVVDLIFNEGPNALQYLEQQELRF